MNTNSSTNPSSDPMPPADRARRILRATDRATLATGQRDAEGWPYPSLVLVAVDHDATPLLLISNLADHTRNIKSDDRVGLLFDATVGLDEPLAGARVSVLGRAVPSEEPRHRARFLARHPGAATYAGFGDFAIHRVAVERAHLVAGFGRIHWVAADTLLYGGGAVAGALAEREADIVGHMNRDHADAIELYATVLLGQPGGGWVMTGVDPEGCDLRRGAAVARLCFDRPVGDADGAQAELVRLAGEARKRQSAGPL
jgi:putative heme iron utilization protein